MAKRINYRKLAFDRYEHLCAHCGFGIPEILDVAHIDQDRANNDVANLVLLCPTCHKMLDLGLISKETICHMRDNPRRVDWKLRMKDAGRKAADTRARRSAARKGSGRKAAATRARRKAARKAVETRRSGKPG